MADTIDAYQVVQVLGEVSSLASIKKWAPAAYENPGLSSSPKVLGLTLTGSTTDEAVAVMRRGYVRSAPFQNSETWAAGDVLWAKSNGSLTKTRPTAPLPLVMVGVVMGVSGSNADISVNVTPIPAITELSGVLVDAPADKDVLIYNAGSTYYETRQLDHGADFVPASMLDDDHPQYLQRIQYQQAHTHKAEDITNLSLGDMILASQIFGS